LHVDLNSIDQTISFESTSGSNGYFDKPFLEGKTWTYSQTSFFGTVTWRIFNISIQVFIREHFCNIVGWDYMIIRATIVRTEGGVEYVTDGDLVAVLKSPPLSTDPKNCLTELLLTNVGGFFNTFITFDSTPEVGVLTPLGVPTPSGAPSPP
jgi:hypothetical protein